jgi:putative flippase GtrA
LSLKRIGAPTPIAQVISRSVGATVGFAGHKVFSFRNRDQSAKTFAAQGTGYLTITLINIAISPAVVTAVEHFLPGNLPLVKVLAEIVMVTETYFVLRWIFKKK